MPNRLAGALSPYLRQHQDNPVDWWEWSPEAFAEARRRDVPVLLSIGYAACHWCHVMAHESFEDPEVARALNADFVSVKVDREERPDVDSVYMAATLALTGQGGWPMTVLMTADGEPFWCGTYLPKGQLVGLIEAASAAWTERRDEVLASGAHITEAVRSAVAPAPPEPITRHTLDDAATRLGRTLDAVHGGFGRAPKFPPSMVLEFLLRHHARSGAADALGMVVATCKAMARGGIYDQLAGGFARYAVDVAWVVPHFEKMLYDNALLARVYLHLWRASGSELARRVALETAGFIVDELGTAQGGFASSLDADTEGVEGLTYVWTPAELIDVLGPDEGARAARQFDVTEAGTFEHGRSTLQLRHDPDDPTWWAGVRERLLAHRRLRPQPGRDDKVVTSWNGLAIAALAEIGVALEAPPLVAAAVRAAGLLLDTHLV
ncbi:MAG: thioredoxin domain-containing protein, partial [Candidatus Phosphoribacter sp.]